MGLRESFALGDQLAIKQDFIIRTTGQRNTSSTLPKDELILYISVGGIAPRNSTLSQSMGTTPSSR